MAWTRFSLLTTLFVSGLIPSSLTLAHSIAPVPSTDRKLQGEISTFRHAFEDAATKKDAVALRNFYTDDFTHTHTSGKVDGKDARIVSVLAAEQTVEVAPVPEFRLSCFGESMCIARALSPIKRATDGKWMDVRWTQTYVKTGKGWQIAVSQATSLPNTVREAP